jgi:integrase
MRTRTKGILAAKDGSKTVNKQYRGVRLFARLGSVSQEEAEIWLRREQDRIDVERKSGTRRNFCDAAERYLMECTRRQVRTTETIAYHIKLVLPYLSTKPLEGIHSGTLASFIEDRLAGAMEITPTTVNRTLEVVRTILLRAARVWRNDDGTPWLGSAPLIEMLPETPRLPYPISWQEQNQLFAELPAHLNTLALFAVNTGLRDNNACGLRWAWERPVPELKRSVFVIPPNEFKTNRHHVAILNDVAWNIVEAQRDKHAEYVFPYRDNRVDSINNTAWQNARNRVGLSKVRVHDLRHTFGQRLREAGVSEEDRAVLMGHAVDGMPAHYATPTIAHLIECANRVKDTRDSPTLLRIVNG